MDAASTGVCKYLVTRPVVLYGIVQGVAGGKDLTLGECSLGQTIPI
jgi:hypothetical protein